MQAHQTHIIRRQNVNVTANVQDAFALKRKIELMMEEVNLRMDSLFDDFVSEKEWLQIDRMDIHIDDFTENNLEETLVEKILLGLREKIEVIKFNRNQIDGDNKIGFEVIPFHQKIFAAFLYFLEYGIFPWWYESASHSLFEEQIEQSLTIVTDENNHNKTKQLSAKLLAILGNFAAQIRLAGQFNEKVYLKSIHLCLTGLNLNAFTEIENIFKILYKSIEATDQKKEAKQIILESKVMLIQKISTSKNVEEFIYLWLQDVIRRIKTLSLDEMESVILNNVELKKYAPKKQKKLESKSLEAYNNKEKESPSIKTNTLVSELEDTDGAILFNSGLIIVAPFLPELFNKCGILKEHEIIDKDRALAILHYIVFGNCHYREYDVLLNKVLCGMDENKPIEIIEDLSKNEKDEIHTMLITAIGYWTALKNTSTEGLREGFLKRRGKIMHKHDEWFLQVEVNTIDALLQELPWTIGFIKLPWMKKILKSQWI